MNLKLKSYFHFIFVIKDTTQKTKDTTQKTKEKLKILHKKQKIKQQN